MSINRPPTLGVNTKVMERYTIVAVVGQGGLGTVYQVRDDLARTPTIFALKETFDLSEGARKQFEMEARWLEKLDHPNIPRVRQYFQWHDRLYLVMDFVAGENLEYKLIRNGQRPLPELDVLRWMHPICDALAYLHNQQPPIIHRDVKPANIIVAPNGRPALVDLGIAKELFPEGDSRTNTFIRKAGTEGYAPPEQYAGKGSTGPHSDIYSLGATMYHLLTGQVPASAVERAALDNQLIAPRRQNPMLMPEVEAIIMRALAIRPSDRFASMHDMERAIGEVLQRATAAPFGGSTATPSSLPMTSGPLRQSYPPQQVPYSPPNSSAPYRPPNPSVPYRPPNPSMPNKSPNGSMPPMELAPTIIRSVPTPQGVVSNGSRRNQRGAIPRPKDRHGSAKAASNGARPSSSLPPAPSSTFPPVANEPPLPRPHALVTPRKRSPWAAIGIIIAILLVVGGIYLGTHDFWPYLFGGNR